jgi:hypothetical protein
VLVINTLIPKLVEQPREPVVRNLSLWTYTLQEDLVRDKLYKHRGM